MTEIHAGGSSDTAGKAFRPRRRGLAAVAIVALLLSIGLLRLSPLWPGPSLPEGATMLALATEPAHLLPTMACHTALVEGRVAVREKALVLVPRSGGAASSVVWRAGWAAWRLAGQA